MITVRGTQDGRCSAVVTEGGPSDAQQRPAMIGISSAPLPRMWRLQAASRSTALGRGSSWNSADRWANISLCPSLATWAHGPGWIRQTVLPGPLSCHQAQIVRLSGRHIPPSAGLAAPERRWSPCAYLGSGFFFVAGHVFQFRLRLQKRG